MLEQDIAETPQGRVLQRAFEIESLTRAGLSAEIGEVTSIEYRALCVLSRERDQMQRELDKQNQRQ